MKKYHVYLDQLKFFSILEEDFLGHLKLASLPSEVVRFCETLGLCQTWLTKPNKLIILHTKVLTLINSFKVQWLRCVGKLAET